ncbi:MAG: NADPH-dependent 2,4-dienoyl-CoA reductase, partial [Pseudomonadota bacterium]
PTLQPDLWRREWGVGDPARTRGGVAQPRPEAPARSVWLLQRKAEKPGRTLGKTTGWIHRAALAAKEVRMLGGVTYLGIDAAGLHIRRDGAEEVIPADTVVICAGQEPVRDLAQALEVEGISHSIIGGADVAAELDAKRAIDQAVRLAAAL